MKITASHFLPRAVLQDTWCPCASRRRPFSAESGRPGDLGEFGAHAEEGGDHPDELSRRRGVGSSTAMLLAPTVVAMAVAIAAKEEIDLSASLAPRADVNTFLHGRHEV